MLLLLDTNLKIRIKHIGTFTTWYDLGAAFGTGRYSLVIVLGYSKTYLITVLMIVVAIVLL